MPVTIAGFTFDYSRGSAGYLRSYADAPFMDPDGVEHPAQPAGGRDFLKEIPFTAASNVATVDTFTHPPTWDEASGARSSVTICILDSNRQKVGNPLVANFRIPTLPSTTTWGALRTYNDTQASIRDTDTYTKQQVNYLLEQNTDVGNPATALDLGRVKTSVTPADAAAPTAIEIADPRVVDVTRYGTLAQAVAAIGSAQTTLQVTTNLTVSSNLTVPENIVLQKKGAGKIIVATGAVLTLARTPDVPRIQFFDQTGVSVSDVSGAGTTTLPASADSQCVITSATANFVSGDVGGWVTLTGAGVGGATVTARIIARISATQVRLDRAIRVASLSSATLTFRFGTVVFSGSKLGDIYPEWFNAHGDAGTTDNTRAFQLALNSVPTGGGKVKVGRGDFYFTSSIFPKSGTTLEGAGESSKLYVPTDEWDVGRYYTAGEFRGLISVFNADGVRIAGLRLVGNLQSDANICPKCIYTHNAERLTVEHCLIEGTFHESIWQGGDHLLNHGHDYSRNRFRNVGTAIQQSGIGIIAQGNHIEDAGAGILLTGSRQTVTGNEISLRDTNSSFCIYLGDQLDSGESVIGFNVCKLTGNGTALLGFKAAIDVTTSTVGSTEPFHPATIVGNSITLVGTASTDPAYNYGIRALYNHRVNCLGNTVEVQVRGTGIAYTPATNSTDPLMYVTSVGNTVEVINESGQSFGFRGLVTGTGTLSLYSASNVVRGISSAGYSYFFDDSVGTVSVTQAGDITYGTANVKLGPRNFFAGTETDINGVPLFASNDLTKVAAHFDVVRVGMLNFQTPIAMTLASGVINIAGVTSGNNYSERRTEIKLDVESGVTDDLDTISGGQTGDVVILRITADARNIVLKHNTGNLRLGSDHTLDTTYDRAVFSYDGTKWVCLSKMTN